MSRIARFSTNLIAVLSLAFFSFAATACDSDTEDPLGSVYDVAVENGFTTLVAAVDAAGLSETLRTDGPFTIFAPTNEAFAALPAGTVETLLQPENIETLTDILTYHVVSGRVTSSQVVTLSSATTLQGGTVTIEVADANVFINGAQVTTVDVEADNGIIHVIDSVLLPGS